MRRLVVVAFGEELGMGKAPACLVAVVVAGEGKVIGGFCGDTPSW